MMEGFNITVVDLLFWDKMEDKILEFKNQMVLWLLVPVELNLLIILLNYIHLSMELLVKIQELLLILQTTVPMKLQ